MSIRYLYNVVLALAAAFLVVATQAFAAPTVAWLAFGIAGGVALASAVMIALRVGLAQRLLAGIALVIAAWTVAASVVFVPTTALWLGFSAGVALVALAVTGLTIHELFSERIVHSIQVSHAPTTDGEREASLA